MRHAEKAYEVWLIKQYMLAIRNFQQSDYREQCCQAQNEEMKRAQAQSKSVRWRNKKKDKETKNIWL